MAQLWPLAFCFLLPLLAAMEGRKPGAVFREFFLFSFIANLLVLYWIPRVMVRYGGTTWFLGLVGLACLSAFFALIAGFAGMFIGRAASRGFSLAAAFWIATVWVAKDLIVEKILGGFPWCLAGYSQYKNTVFVQLAELGGIHLVTFLVIAVNALLYRLLKKKDRATAVTLVALLAAVYACGFWLLRGEEARSREIPWHMAGIVQPNSDHDRPVTNPRIESELEKLFQVSRELREQGAEFVVWPEFTVPIYPLQAPSFRERFDAFSREYAPLLAGFTDYGGDRVFNSAMLFQNGEMQKYDKVHLTPFGEYVLFRRLLFFVKKITDEIGDFTPGARLRNLELAGQRLSTPICYEVIYPELVRSLIAQGGQLIVTISNDSWFGDSSAPYQHLAMATMRCVENRRWLLRSTSNGISALVSPSGRIVRQSPLHEPDSFLASFQYRSGRTVFTRWGYWFPYGCLLLAACGLFLPRSGRKGRPIGPSSAR